MRTRTLHLIWSAGLVLLASTLVYADGLQAQATPEGTVITNTATVSWTDANSNSYTPVNGSVNVTVGFGGGVDVIAAAATAGPASPSTADTLTFDIVNVGNGTDSVSVSESISDATVITVTGYRYGVTTYGTLAALNSALAGVSMAVNDTINVKVVYDVASNKGGTPSTYTLTGTSRRDNTKSDNDATTVTPGLTVGVAVTPDGGQNVQKLPSNGTNYTFTFTVTNNSNGVESFDLLGSSPGSAVITLVSVNGVAGDSTRISSVAAGASQNIDVVYSVADVAAGSADTLNLKARAVSDGTTNDDGYADLTVIKASISITKQAYRDDQTTLLGGGDTVAPGEFIQYKITVTNNGGADATSVHVDDLLPSEVTYNTATGDAAGWTFTESAGDVDADLSGSLAASASRYFWIRVQIN